jgi:hypothetical protein
MSLSNKFSGVYNAYEQVHAVAYPISQSMDDVMSTMGRVVNTIDDFMAPFTPFEGIMNTVTNILSYIQ